MHPDICLTKLYAMFHAVAVMFYDLYDLKSMLPSFKGTMQCDKSFNRANTLMRHMMQHSGVNPYLCAQCNHSFTQAETLKRHMREHSGDQPYNCEQCDQSFTQADNLDRHMIKT